MIGKIEKEIERIRQIKWWRKDQALQVMTIWKHSEISLLRFCRQYHIGYKRLLRWKRILESQAGSMGFVQVEIPVQPAIKADDKMEIVLCNGLTIRIHPGFDTESLRRVIGIAEES